MTDIEKLVAEAEDRGRRQGLLDLADRLERGGLLPRPLSITLLHEITEVIRREAGAEIRSTVFVIEERK